MLCMLFAALFAAAKVLDFVLYGSDEAKLVFIFTEQGEKVADKIIVSLDAGLSFIHWQPEDIQVKAEK